MSAPEAPGAVRPAGHWRGDLAGGLSAALVALPIELIYGLFAVAPLGLDWAEHGLRAALGVDAASDWRELPASWHPLNFVVFGMALDLCFWLRRRYPLLPGPALAMLAGTLLHHGLRVG